MTSSIRFTHRPTSLHSIAAMPPEMSLPSCFASPSPVSLRHRLPRSPPHHSLSSLSRRPLARRLPTRACAQPLDRPGRSRPTSAPSDLKPTRGLLLERRTVEGSTRRGRTLRVRRWATLSDVVGADSALAPSALAAATARVEVAVAVQRVRTDFRVVGAVRAPLKRRCDRCNALFDATSRGKFELWLATDESGELGDISDIIGEGDVEAVEGFSGAVAKVDLTQHVRDAVWLGLPTKSLCAEECVGVQISDRDSAFASVTYSGGPALEKEEPEEEEMRSIGERRDAAKVLTELKRRLEMQGK